MRVCIPSFYKAELDHLQQMYATAWKITQDVIYDLGQFWMMKVNAYGKHQRMLVKFQEHE